MIILKKSLCDKKDYNFSDTDYSLDDYVEY